MSLPAPTDPVTDSALHLLPDCAKGRSELIKFPSVQSAARLANLQGDDLKAGEILLTGGLTAAPHVTIARHLNANITGFDYVSLTIQPDAVGPGLLAGAAVDCC